MRWIWTALCVLLTTAAADAQLTLRDLQGSWISDPYARSLEQTRSALLPPTSLIEPVAFKIHENGSTWRIDVMNFHEGTWRSIESLKNLGGNAYELTTGPYEAEPPLKEHKRFRLEITVDQSGRPSAIKSAIWEDGKVVLHRRLDSPVLQWAGRILIAGHYRDAKGGAWTFDAQGSGASPEGAFHWEPVLDSSEACTDYMILRRAGMKQDAEDRTAWRRKDGKLQLSAIVINDEGDCPITAAKKPFAVLTPEAGK